MAFNCKKTCELCRRKEQGKLHMFLFHQIRFTTHQNDHTRYHNFIAKSHGLHIVRHRQTDRQTDRQIDTDTDADADADAVADRNKQERRRRLGQNRHKHRHRHRQTQNQTCKWVEYALETRPCTFLHFTRQCNAIILSSAPSPCEDKSRLCPKLAQEGECHARVLYMIKYCQKSCNICHSTETKKPGNLPLLPLSLSLSLSLCLSVSLNQ